MTPEVTVIVPVRDAATTVGQAVLSVLDQQAVELEVVVVDNGSTDGTPRIVADLARVDTRVRVVEEQVPGPSTARNRGLQHASGDYVAFLDADDHVDPDWLSGMLGAARSDDAEMVVTGCLVDVVDSRGRLLTRRKESAPHLVLPDQASSVPGSVSTVNLLGYVWNKLYRRDVLEGLRFDEAAGLHEDLAFNLDVLSRAGRVAWADQAAVHYVQRPGPSQGRRAHPAALQHRVQCLKGVAELWGRWGVPGGEGRRTLAHLFSTALYADLVRAATDPSADVGSCARRVSESRRSAWLGAARRDLAPADALPWRDRVWIRAYQTLPARLLVTWARMRTGRPRRSGG